MIKVANVIEEGRFGGPQSEIMAVAERLKENGIKTVVVFPKKDSAIFYKKLTEKGIQTKRLSLHRLTKQKSHLIKYFIFFVPEVFSLYRFFKKERVEIVHCNGSWQIKGIIAGRLAKAKLLWHLNDTQIPSVINIIFKFLALYFCDAFITSGERVSSYYLNGPNFSIKKTMIICPPVDTFIFDPKKAKEDKKIMQFQGKKIITVGNINPLKGIEHFIEMAAILNSQYDDLSFFVVGPHFGSQKKYSEKLSKMVRNLKLKNLYFYGPSDDVASVLKSADIFVCSSVTESGPMSVWEAMSMAKPIVSTDVGDVARFIKDGENGFIVPIKDAVALAEKVSILIENKDLRKNFGQQAREVAVRYLDVDICAKKHAQFYREIMNE